MAIDVKPLESETIPLFNPKFMEDLDKRNRANMERARTTITMGPQLFTNLEGPNDIKIGSQTRKYDRLARSDNSVYLPLRTILSAAFWIEGALQRRNDYSEHPEFEIIDDTIIQFIEQTFEAFSYQSFRKSLEDVVYSAMVCGFSVAEKLWESIDGRWVLRALKSHPSWNFEPEVDEWSNLQGIFHSQTGETFHPGAFVWAVWPRIHAGNWLGQSELEAIRHDVLLLEKLEKAQAINTDQTVKKAVVHTYNAVRSPEEQDISNKAIDNALLGNKNGIVHLPATQDINLKLAASDEIEILQDRTAPEALKQTSKIIDESKKEISRALGLPDDLGMTTATSGSWAKAQTVFNLFISRAEEVQRFVVDVVNRDIISDIIRFNFDTLPDGYKCPFWEYPELEETVSLDKADFIGKLVTSGVIDLNDSNDNEWARKVVDAPPPVADDTDSEPDTDEAEAQMDLLFPDL